MVLQEGLKIKSEEKKNFFWTITQKSIDTTQDNLFKNLILETYHPWTFDKYQSWEQLWSAYKKYIISHNPVIQSNKKSNKLIDTLQSYLDKYSEYTPSEYANTIEIATFERKLQEKLIGFITKIMTLLVALWIYQTEDKNDDTMNLHQLKESFFDSMQQLALSWKKEDNQRLEMFNTINTTEKTIEDQFKNHIASTVTKINDDKSMLNKTITETKANIDNSEEYIASNPDINPLYKKKIQTFIERLSSQLKILKEQQKTLQNQQKTYNSIQNVLHNITQDKTLLDANTKEILNIIRSHNQTYNNIETIDWIETWLDQFYKFREAINLLKEASNSTISKYYIDTSSLSEKDQNTYQSITWFISEKNDIINNSLTNYESQHLAREYIFNEITSLFTEYDRLIKKWFTQESIEKNISQIQWISNNVWPENNENILNWRLETIQNNTVSATLSFTWEIKQLPEKVQETLSQILTLWETIEDCKSTTEQTKKSILQRIELINKNNISTRAEQNSKKITEIKKQAHDYIFNIPADEYVDNNTVNNYIDNINTLKLEINDTITDQVIIDTIQQLNTAWDEAINTIKLASQEHETKRYAIEQQLVNDQVMKIIAEVEQQYKHFYEYITTLTRSPDLDIVSKIIEMKEYHDQIKQKINTYPQTILQALWHKDEDDKIHIDALQNVETLYTPYVSFLKTKWPTETLPIHELLWNNIDTRSTIEQNFKLYSIILCIHWQQVWSKRNLQVFAYNKDYIIIIEWYISSLAWSIKWCKNIDITRNACQDKYGNEYHLSQITWNKTILLSEIIDQKRLRNNWWVFNHNDIFTQALKNSWIKSFNIVHDLLNFWLNVFDIAKTLQSTWFDVSDIATALQSAWSDASDITAVLKSIWYNERTIATVLKSIWYNERTIAIALKSIWFDSSTIAIALKSIWFDVSTIATALQSIWSDSSTIATALKSIWSDSSTIATALKSIWFNVNNIATVLKSIWSDSSNTVIALKFIWLNNIYKIRDTLRSAWFWNFDIKDALKSIWISHTIIDKMI
jgi:hypothetical protein